MCLQKIKPVNFAHRPAAVELEFAAEVSHTWWTTRSRWPATSAREVYGRFSNVRTQDQVHKWRRHDLPMNSVLLAAWHNGIQGKEILRKWSTYKGLSPRSLTASISQPAFSSNSAISTLPAYDAQCNPVFSSWNRFWLMFDLCSKKFDRIHKQLSSFHFFFFFSFFLSGPWICKKKKQHFWQ